MDQTILIFLGVALAILALALFLSKAFKKTIERDKRNEDLNGDSADGRGVATWLGVGRSGNDHLDN